MPPNLTNELNDGLDGRITYSVRLLSQFDYANINPYALNYSRLALTRYKTSTLGERVFNTCFTNLPVFVATDDNLQFGWNEQSVWRNLDLHQYEYEHLLLIAAVSECLPESYAGAVLSCLASKVETAELVKPALGAWRALVQSINGLLTTSDFPLMIDDRMRLDPYRVTSGHSTSCTNSLIAPEAFADALQALGDLSVAGSGQVTLVGGNFLGWFASIAELFLGISVQICSRDDQVLYTTHTDSKAMLRLVFVDDVTNLTPTLRAQDMNITVLNVMCDRDAEAKVIPRVPFTGRLGWEALLPKVFEHCFHSIAHQHSNLFVKSVGGIARLLALWVEDPNTPEDLVSAENKRNPASYGMGLVQTLCNWFPELRHLEGRLEKMQRLATLEEVSQKCNDGAVGFNSICNCTICSLPAFYGNEDTDALPQSFCPLAIMETILNMALAMSRITVVPKLYPSRAGVLAIYQRQVRKLLMAKEQVAKSGAPNADTYEKYSRVRMLFARDWNANYSERLQTAVALFSGSWPDHDVPENLVALSHEGICANVLGVQYGDEKAARRKDADVIRVLPGNISWKQKIYSRACLGVPKGISNSDYSWELAPCSHLSKGLYCK